MPEGALSDLKVLELADFISGPYCTKLMADLGAEVIKVEQPGSGDSSRRYGPFPGDAPSQERSLLFAYLNTSKKGITLDVRTALGKELFLELVKQADILVENSPPKLMEELGLDYASLSEVNSGLIMTSITPFGQSGPYRDYKGNDLVCMHTGGIGYATPGGVDDWETQPPMKAPGHSGDFMAATTAAPATMMAVMAREFSGSGQHVDVSEQDSLAVIMRGDVMSHYHLGQTPSRIAGMSRMVASRSPIQCKDGYFSLQVFLDNFWDGVRRVMGNPDWAELDLFKDRQSRMDNLDALLPLLEQWSMDYSKEELYQMLQVQNHIPCTPVNSVPDLLTNAHYRERDVFIDMEHPVIGKFKAPGTPHRFSESPWAIYSPAPILGQHNQEIICGRLGYSKEDLVRMRQLGAV